MTLRSSTLCSSVLGRPLIRRHGFAFLLLAWLGLAALPAAAQTRFIAFGDSITAGTGDSATGAPGYPGRLETLLRNAGQTVEVLNRGMGAERTVEGITRLDQVLAADGGQVLLLMEGSNDISRGYALEDTQFNLGQMAIKAESRGMAVVQATTIPRTPSALVDPLNRTNQQLNELIRHQVGLRSSRRLADNFFVFGSQPNLFATYYWLEPTDFVGHPNANGYDLMAQMFFNAINAIDRLPPVEGVIVPANGSPRVGAGQTISVELWDYGAGIDSAETRLLVNGQEVAAIVTGGTRLLQLSWTPTAPLSGVVRVGYRSRDLANPVNTVEREVSRFVVAGTVLLGGDFDRDGRVDGADLVAIGRRFGARTGDTHYSVLYDINEDGSIDGTDLAVVASNFGRTSS